MALTAIGVLALAAALGPGCLVQAVEPSLPTVESVECPELNPKKDYDRCWTINFNDGSGEDIIGLHYVDGKEDNMLGELVHGGGSVTVTLDEDVACYTISKPPAKMYMFTVDLTTGETKDPELPLGQRLTYVRPPPSNESSSSGEEAVETRAASFPPEGFQMKICVLYDQAFKSKFANKSDTTIDKVFNHVNNLFSHSSLDTTITTIVVKKEEVRPVVPASKKNLRAVANYVGAAELPEADAYVLLTMEDLNNASGIAYLGVTCEERKWRVSIVEYYSNDLVTAQIVVHEIGHNLGMKHDFDVVTSGGIDYKQDKRSSKGVACTNQAGYMDYLRHKNKWSECSVEDFASYFRANQPYCLQTGSGPGPVPQPKPTQPPPPPCVNNVSNKLCYFGFSLCHYDWWKTHCKNTCLVCCSDLKDSSYCEGNSNRCSQSAVVRFYCAKTCGLC